MEDHTFLRSQVNKPRQLQANDSFLNDSFLFMEKKGEKQNEKQRKMTEEANEGCLPFHSSGEWKPGFVEKYSRLLLITF